MGWDRGSTHPSGAPYRRCRRWPDRALDDRTPSGESGCSAFPCPYRCERANELQPEPEPANQFKLKSEPRDPDPESRGWRPILLSDLRDNPCADGPAAFANGEAQARVHGDRSDQLDADVHVIAGHHHFGALGEDNLTGDV